ncbi:TetR/AcrR family transcriptional regulator [Asaia krungthepensis]|uniref:TetR family transcriptional regulator n=1 Tax=Asaia krungthepensis NRIC 0535 TaxID=1307925 RepID=A0ABQ0PW03_9PROT|nr:TetR/AcrR family transcriptional regulator [Asaia krungthepensis]GBQ82982.1 TetR family transcriptional regulator [Asaia krungthepensis NRIC 0535]
MTDTPKARRPRSDGQRSRLALLAAARSAFMAGESDIRMDAIASRAGVGVGTLYRHFADRSALIEAVYADERDQLVASAPVLAARHKPLEALRQWMQLFVAYAATKKMMTPVLETVTGGAASLHERSGAPIIDAMQRLTSACVTAGALRDDIDPMDMLRAVYGVCTIAGDRPQQAVQFIDIVLAGARPGVTP